MKSRLQAERSAGGEGIRIKGVAAAYGSRKRFSRTTAGTDHTITVDAAALDARGGGYSERLGWLVSQGVGDREQSRGNCEIQRSAASREVHGQSELGGLAAGIVGGEGEGKWAQVVAPGGARRHVGIGAGAGPGDDHAASGRGKRGGYLRRGLHAARVLQWNGQAGAFARSEEHTSELQSPVHLVCR